MESLLKINRKDLQFNGIYKITNIKNNKFYIGSCSSKGFIYERLIHHKEDLIKNKHCNNYLQRSFNKYGIDNFYYEVIEMCDPEECIATEQWWIDKLQPHYNLCKKAGSSLGTICSQETRNKISIANKKWFKTEEGLNLKTKLSNRLKGKKLSVERIEQLRQARLGKKHSDEYKQLMKVKISKKIKNLDTNEIYLSLKDAAVKLKINYGYLSRILNEKRRDIKRRKIKFNLQWT